MNKNSREKVIAEIRNIPLKKERTIKALNKALSAIAEAGICVEESREASCLLVKLLEEISN